MPETSPDGAHRNQIVYIIVQGGERTQLHNSKNLTMG